MNRFHVMTFGTQRLNEFARQVFVEEDFHDGWRSGLWASSARTPRTDSSLRLGYASTISAMLMPAARDSRIRATDMRVPRTRGLPPRCTASATIQVSIYDQAYARCFHEFKKHTLL